MERNVATKIILSLFSKQALGSYNQFMQICRCAMCEVSTGRRWRVLMQFISERWAARLKWCLIDRSVTTGDSLDGADSIADTLAVNAWRHNSGAGLAGQTVVDCGLYSTINHLSNHMAGVMRKVHNLETPVLLWEPPSMHICGSLIYYVYEFEIK